MQHCCSINAAKIRGVDPALASFYTSSSKKFKCIDGLKIIPFSQVNDEYCDCFDGSDEPGTPACPDGKFYCANIGYEPLLLNASFVDDGVCDCCDGSDEPQGKCPNTCKSLGTQTLNQLKTDLSQAESGLKTKSRLITEAAKARSTWTTRLEAIKTMEGGADAKAQQTAAARDAIVKQFDALSARVHTLEEITGYKASTTTDNDNSGDIDMNQENIGDDDVVVDDDSAIDHGDDDIVDDSILVDEDEHHDGGETEEELAQRVASQWIPGSKNKDNADDNNSDDVEMDMPSTTTTTTTTEEEEIVTTADVDVSNDDTTNTNTNTTSSEGDVSIDLGIVGMVKSRIAELVATVTGKKGKEAELLKARVELDALRKRVQSARDTATSAQTTIDNLRNEKSDLERKISLTYGDHDAYLPLSGNCYEAHVDKYTYKVCPFDKSSQVDGGHETSLGTWEGFDATTGKHMRFTNGEHCWQGPSRSMTVEVVCGVKEMLSRVAEPSRCEYTAQLTTPAACSSEIVDELKAQVERKKRLLDSLVDGHSNDEL